MKHALETTYHIIADHKIETILLASVLVYAAAFSHFTYLKHYTFSSFAWDLGVFNQVLHDTAFEGKPFYYTPDLYFNGSGSYLVMHFSPILFTLLPIYIVTHLGDVIQALSYDPVLKLLYIVFLFGPLLFLPLTSRSMAPILLLLAPFLLSNYQAYYMIGSHYSLYLIAPIFVALIMVYKHNLGGERRRLARNMLLVTIFFSALLSPVSGVINSKDPILWYPPPMVVTDRVNALHGLIGEVPESVSILTQNHIFPHFSDRINAYVIPELPASADQEAYLRNYIDELMTRSDYILLDLRTYDAATAYVFEKALREGSGHRIALYEDSAVLITREEGPSVTISDSYPRTYTVNSGLSVGKGAITTDPTSESTEVAESTPGSRSGHLVFGPYEFMDRGTYTITLALKNPTRFEGYLGTFDVYDSGDVITKRNVYGYEFEPGDWTTAKITLTLRQAKAAIEYRFEANDQTSVLIDYVKVELAQGPAPGDSTRSIDARDLTTASSRVTPDGLIVSNANGPQPVDAAWFGPYLTLPPGNYTVTYQLKPVKLTQAAGPTILYADIATGNGKKTLAGRWITLEDMRELRAGWYSTAFDLRLGEETELEFRGGEIQPGWSVSLSQIIVEPDG